MKLGIQNELAIRALDGGVYVANDLVTLAATVSTGFNKEHDPETNRHATILSLGPISERGRTTAMGDWVTVPYGTVTFAASGTMAWTVPSASQNRYRYTLIGHTLFLSFAFKATSVTAPLSTQLLLPLPPGITAHASTQQSPFTYTDNGTFGVGVAQVLTGATNVSLSTASVGNWSASVANTAVIGQLAIEVE